METTVYHIPALLRQTIDGLNIKPDGVYVDCTFGGGGHARAILEKLNKNGRLLVFDQDEQALKNAVADKRLILVHGNFKYLSNFLIYHGYEKVDGILADLGVSFHHFDEADRGFSLRFDSQLDMRMNQQSKLTAAQIIQTYTEEQLADVFYYYGELRNARNIARTIVKQRELQTIESNMVLQDILNPLFHKGKEKKEMTKVFQALRIEVNDEMTALKSLLEQSVQVLQEDGRMAILSYHSLEDRLVKNFFKAGNFEGKVEQDFYGNFNAPFKAIGKLIVADADEVKANPRARSAKLRIAALHTENNR